MDNLKQQMRATRDKLRRRMDWRPGESALSKNLPLKDWAIYSPQFQVVYVSDVVQEVDEIIHRMMGCESPGDEV